MGNLADAQAPEIAWHAMVIGQLAIEFCCQPETYPVFTAWANGQGMPGVPDRGSVLAMASVLDVLTTAPGDTERTRRARDVIAMVRAWQREAARDGQDA